MNIGFVTDWLEQGAGVVSKQYEKIFSESGHNTFIYSRENSRAINANYWGHRNYFQGSKLELGEMEYYPKQLFLEWISKNQIEVLFFNEQRWLAPVKWAKQKKVITVGYVDYYRRKDIKKFKHYDVLVCNTLRHYSVFNWHSKCLYIPWGTDLDIFTPNLKSHTDDVVFFHSCGWSPERKGTELVIKAFQQINNSNSKLIIHSQVNLEEFLSQNKIQIKKELDLNRIEIIEGTFSAPGLYNLGDIYVYPTKLEGLGLTIFEASSCGLPIIVPDNPPMNERVEPLYSKKVSIDKFTKRIDGYFWLECHTNLTELTKCMQWYVDNSKVKSEWVKKSREFAVNNFDWRVNSADLVVQMQKLLELRKNATENKAINISSTFEYLNFLIFKIITILKTKTKKILNFSIFGQT